MTVCVGGSIQNVSLPKDVSLRKECKLNYSSTKLSLSGWSGESKRERQKIPTNSSNLELGGSIYRLQNSDIYLLQLRRKSLNFWYVYFRVDCFQKKARPDGLVKPYHAYYLKQPILANSKFKKIQTFTKKAKIDVKDFWRYLVL